MTLWWLVYIAVWLAAWLCKRWELRIIEASEGSNDEPICDC